MVDYTADTASRQQDDLDRMAARSLAARRTKTAAPRERTVIPWVIGAVLLALLLGMVASPWFERQVRGRMPAALQADKPVAVDPRVDELLARVARLETGPVAMAGVQGPAPEEMAPITGRIAALEAQAAAFQSSDATIASRLEQLAADLQRTSGMAEAGDRQVRDLFMLSVARRMLESGRPLGPVQAALAARFSTQDAAAIEALERWSMAPHTRASLAARLKTMDKAVAAQPAAPAGFWDRLTARISGLVTVRDGTVAAPVEADVLVAARDAMVAGDMALASARLQRAPPSVVRDQWLADAQALIAAEAALGRLETMLLDAASADASALASAIVPPAVVPDVAGSGSAPPAP